MTQRLTPATVARRARPLAWADDPAYQRAVKRAVTSSRAGELKLWVSCFACAQVVGRYEWGATKALAEQLNRSVDTVEARARAAVTYRRLFAMFRDDPELRRRLRELRRELSFSHFAEGGELLRQDVPALEVFGQLDTAALVGAGVRALSIHAKDKAANWHEFPVWNLDDKTVRDRNGRATRIVVLPDDYVGESVKVRL